VITYLLPHLPFICSSTNESENRESIIIIFIFGLIEKKLEQEKMTC